MPAPKDKGTYKNLEGFFLQFFNQLLNEQAKSNVYTFFETASLKGSF